MKACFISLGCVKNLVDSECILGLLKKGNIEITDEISESDIIFINTCGFIDSAKKEAIDTIFDVISNKNDNAFLVVIGCLAKRYKTQLMKEIPEIDLIIGVDEYNNIGVLLNDLINTKMPKTFKMIDRSLTNPLPTAYLKIGEGCSNKCAYCAIPIIRGDYYSFKKEDIIEDAKRLIKLGKKEIIVIAQDPTRYGKDIYSNYELKDLLIDLLKLDSNVYYRVLYLYPDRITSELIDVFKDFKNLIPYFDIPIQHSSNKILALMGRSGTKEKYITVIDEIKRKIPYAVLRTTIITGFPGETENDFDDLKEFIQNIKFDHLGVFAYSKEQDTPSYNMENQVKKLIAKQREKELMKLQKNISLELNKKRIGEKQKVLVENFDGKYYYGRSYLFAPDADDGTILIKPTKSLIIGEFINVVIIEAKPYDLIGTIE